MLNADVRKGGRGVWSNADTCGQGGGGMKRGHFLRTSFMDNSLLILYTLLILFTEFLCSCKPLCVCVKGGLNKRRLDLTRKAIKIIYTELQTSGMFVSNW